MLNNISSASLIASLLVLFPLSNIQAKGKWLNNCDDSKCSSLTYEREETTGSGNPEFMAYVFSIHPEGYMSIANTWDEAFERKVSTLKPKIMYQVDGYNLVIHMNTAIPEDPEKLYLTLNGTKKYPDKCVSNTCFFTKRETIDELVKYLNGSKKKVPIHRKFSESNKRLLMTLSSKGFTSVYAKTHKSAIKDKKSKATFTAANALEAVKAKFKRYNKYSVSSNDLKVKNNSLGDGYFVYIDRSALSRPVVWYANKNGAMKLNSPTHSLTPSLPWPQDIQNELVGTMDDMWKGTGLTIHNITEQGLAQTGN